jgi:type I site-specific restriction endonuclease
MNEADTCRTYIVPKLKSAGWEDDFITEQLFLTPGQIVPIGDRHARRDGLRPAYVLFIRQNIYQNMFTGGFDLDIWKVDYLKSELLNLH